MAQHEVRYAAEIAECKIIRRYASSKYLKCKMEGPQTDVLPSAWKWANPENIRSFTAVGYFLLKDLQKNTMFP